MNLSDGITMYLADREARGMKPGTIRAERNTLTKLLADVGNLQLNQIKPKHLDVFYAKHKDWSPSTKNKARAHLSAFVQWCQVRGHIRRDASPMEGTKKIREPKKDHVVIPQSEFETFLEGIEDPRARAIAAIGLYLFTDKSTTASLRWQDFNLDAEKPTVTARMVLI